MRDRTGKRSHAMTRAAAAMKPHSQAIGGGETLQVSGAMLSLVLHFTGAVTMPSEGLAVAWTAFGSPIVLAVVRLSTRLFGVADAKLAQVERDLEVDG